MSATVMEMLLNAPSSTRAAEVMAGSGIEPTVDPDDVARDVGRRVRAVEGHQPAELEGVAGPTERHHLADAVGPTALHERARHVGDEDPWREAVDPDAERSDLPG